MYSIRYSYSAGIRNETLSLFWTYGWLKTLQKSQSELNPFLSLKFCEVSAFSDGNVRISRWNLIVQSLTERQKGGLQARRGICASVQSENSNRTWMGCAKLRQNCESNS